MIDAQARVLSAERMELDFETASDGGVWLLLPHSSIDDAIAEVEDRLDEAERRFGSALMGFRVRLPPSVGSGVIDAVRTSPRVYVMTYDVEYIRERLVNVPGDRLVKVRIVLAGGLYSVGNDIDIDGVGAFLEAYPGEVDSDYIIKPGIRQRLVILMCAPEFFVEDMGLSVDSMPPALRHIFDHASGPPLASVTPLGPELLRAANDVIRSNSHYSGVLHRRYLDTKAREMACAIVRDLARPKQLDPIVARLSVRDVNRIHEARDMLADQFRDPPTIPRLARQVGLNQTKLKAAFKAVFGLTLNDFTLQCRMDRATELLTTTGLSVGEISYAIGYNYPANFAHAFRRYYGHAPRQLRAAQSPPELPNGHLDPRL